METLRRPVVFKGVTYPEYEMDFYTSNIYGKRFKDRALKVCPDHSGYQMINIYLPFNHPPKKKKTARIHKILAETFQDLLPKSPLVSYYNLQLGRNLHELKTPTGFSFISKMVCPDHIDSNTTNNDYANLMIVTQFENLLKCGPIKGRQYKGLSHIERKKPWQVTIKFESILDENGKFFHIARYFKSEEEAALAYNTLLEDAMLTIWGPDLGPKMYDLAYKNEVPALCQTSFEGF